MLPVPISTQLPAVRRLMQGWHAGDAHAGAAQAYGDAHAAAATAADDDDDDDADGDGDSVSMGGSDTCSDDEEEDASEGKHASEDEDNNRDEATAEVEVEAVQATRATLEMVAREAGEQDDEAAQEFIPVNLGARKARLSQPLAC